LIYFLISGKTEIKKMTEKQDGWCSKEFNSIKLNEAIRMIAKLGGFLGEKMMGRPGMTCIWRGWEKLALISEFWLSIHEEATYG
jgi:hypothetical protein